MIYFMCNHTLTWALALNYLFLEYCIITFTGVTLQFRLSLISKDFMMFISYLRGLGTGSGTELIFFIT